MKWTHIYYILNVNATRKPILCFVNYTYSAIDRRSRNSQQLSCHTYNPKLRAHTHVTTYYKNQSHHICPQGAVRLWCVFVLFSFVLSWCEKRVYITCDETSARAPRVDRRRFGVRRRKRLAFSDRADAFAKRTPCTTHNKSSFLDFIRVIFVKPNTHNNELTISSSV